MKNDFEKRLMEQNSHITGDALPSGQERDLPSEEAFSTDLEPPKRMRKTPYDLVRAIIDALPEEGLMPTSEIADEIHSKTDTVLDYLRLIQWVQSQPLVLKERVGKRRYGWKRLKVEEKKGRKTK